jgi:glycosyltransferase involved in cell wall biosynthesis
LIHVDWLITGLNVSGGAEIFTYRIMPYLQRKGLIIRVITLRSGGALVQRMRDYGMPVLELGVVSKRSLLPLIRLYNELRINRPDIIHTHLYHAGIVGRLIGTLAGVKHIIVHQHGAELNRSWSRCILDRLTSWMVKRYVVTCKAVGAVLEHREHIHPSKIQIIYNGIEAIPTDLPRNPNPSQNVLTIPVIGCVSRLVKEKNHAIILAAFQILKQQGVDFRAIMVGDGPERVNLEILSEDLGLSEYVSWVGNQVDVIPWLLKFDIFVLASAWEGLSLSLLEAMAVKLPVVATSVGGTPEVVLHEQTGLLVPPGDVSSLYIAIHSLISNAELRTQMGNAGWQRVTDNFTMLSTVKAILNLYSQVLDH